MSDLGVMRIAYGLALITVTITVWGGWIVLKLDRIARAIEDLRDDKEN